MQELLGIARRMQSRLGIVRIKNRTLDISWRETNAVSQSILHTSRRIASLNYEAYLTRKFSMHAGK